MLLTGLGSNIVASAPVAQGQPEVSSLSGADFETVILIPDKTSAPQGIFILPVACQTAYDSDGQVIAEYMLQGAVAVNGATAEYLESLGLTPKATMMQASAEANAQNQAAFQHAQRTVHAARWVRSAIPLKLL